VVGAGVGAGVTVIAGAETGTVAAGVGRGVGAGAAATMGAGAGASTWGAHWAAVAGAVMTASQHNPLDQSSTYMTTAVHSCNSTNRPCWIMQANLDSFTVQLRQHTVFVAPLNRIKIACISKLQSQHSLTRACQGVISEHRAVCHHTSILRSKRAFCQP